MHRKQRLTLGVGIIIVILLLLVASWRYTTINFATERIFITGVQNNLVELEGLIAHQMEHDWSEPNLVTVQLGDVLDGLWLGMDAGGQLNSLSNREKELLDRLNRCLQRYPRDELYQFALLTEEDRTEFEQLRADLRDAGLGLNMAVSSGMRSFLNQIEILVENMEASQFGMGN